jgi:tetratricopeptide (TPR) repeat protein
MINSRTLHVLAAILAFGHCAFLEDAPARAQAPEALSDEEVRERQTAERFLAVLEKNPRRGTALDRVYGYHVEHGTLDALVKGYEDRTARDAKDGLGWLLLGLFEAQRGRDAAAVAALRRAEAARPDDPLASYYLGQTLVLIGQPDAAVEAFERAIARKPGRADLLPIFQALGRVHQRAYHSDKALEVWGRLEALFPDDLRVQEQIANELADEADPARALPRFEALAKKTTDPYRKVQFQIEAAELKVRLGRKDEALAQFESLLAGLQPESWLYRDVRHRIEDVFLRNDDQAALAAYYERWLKTHGDDVEAMARLGRTLTVQGRSAEARKWLDNAVKRAPGRLELRRALIDQLVQEKDLAAAAAQYQAMAAANPGNTDLLRDWGRLLLNDTSRPEAARKQAAAAIWKKLLDAKPKDAVTTVLVADLYRQAEMPEEAIALYKKAITLAPDAAQYYEYLGEYYHSLKRKTEALEVWGRIAAGPQRNARNLTRLADVLAGFGYRDEAMAPLAEACRLAPAEFDTQLKYAALLQEAGKPDDALKQLDRAAKAADGYEQAEMVLDQQIKAYQANKALADQIAALSKDLEAGRDASAERWRRLARYLEADHQLAEATVAVDKAVAKDANSVAAWTEYARIHEVTGDLGGAADACRTLAKLDRRSLTEYLTRIARLEARLGRRDRALAAGRDLLAAAPGKPESYEFFAGLCSELGAVEEGLNALRRAVRVNPNDARALATLGDALASEFRTDEAIELYWRAFDRAGDLDTRLGHVAKLTDLYLQRNQFDRLIARLEASVREAKEPREMTSCLAQAYQSSGDFGNARAVLERLLAASPRDTALLAQLSSLAETDGDLSAAAKYQRQANEIAPGDDGTARLANLYLRSGETTEAEAIWLRMAQGKQEPARRLATIDSLLAGQKPETALALVERLLREGAGTERWEVLYREGLAFHLLDKPDEAAKRFRALLELPGKDDERSSEVKAAEHDQAARPAGTKRRVARRGARTANANAEPQRLITRTSGSLYELLQATGLSDQRFFGYNRGSSPQVWTPDDFGAARMASLGWLLRFARKANTEDAFVAGLRKAADQQPPSTRALLDWYYLSLVRQEPVETFQAVKALAQATAAAAGGGDPEVLVAFLQALPQRAMTPAQQRGEEDEDEQAADKTPPLAGDDLTFVLTCFRDVQKRRRDWVDETIIDAVANELKRARGQDEAERFSSEAQASLGHDEALRVAQTRAIKRGDVTAFLKGMDELLKANVATPWGQASLAGYSQTLQEMMALLADKKAHADVLKLVDGFFAAYDEPDRAAERRKRYRAGTQGQRGQFGVQIKSGRYYRYVQIDFPTPNRELDTSALTVLRAAFELFKRDDVLSDLFTHAQASAEAAKPAERVERLLALGYLRWWNDEKDEAVRVLTAAAEQAQGDPEPKLELAEIRARRNEPDEALALVESVEPADQKTMERRELMALNLAVVTGNSERARKAAERLFNLRLDTDLQVQLAAQMHQLNMHALAEAVLARARRRAGANTQTLVGLMQQYQRQNQMDIAVQVAHQILRHAPARQYSPYQDSNDVARREAIQVLARSGKLQELIARVEAQLATSPTSVRLLQTLADYHQAAGDEAKAHAALERLGQTRASDPGVQFQIGLQLLKGGDRAQAIPHLKAAIVAQPSLLSNRYWEVENAFRQANKLDELAAMFETMELKNLGGYYVVQNLVSNLLRDAQSQERGLRLFRKVWAAYPQQRAEMIGQFVSDDLWKLPEIYNYAREALIPAPGQKVVARWAGLDAINSWSGGGEVNGVAEQLLGAAAKQNMLDALQREVSEAVDRNPDWSAGKVLLVMIRARRGQLDDAVRGVKELLAEDAKDKHPIPYATRLFLAQELGDREAFRPLVLTLYETAMKENGEENSGLDYEYHPVRRLVALYKKLGRNADARAVALRVARRRDSNNYDPTYALARRSESIAALGRELLDLGYPADALAQFNEVLSSSEAIAAMKQYRGGGDNNYIINQLHEGLRAALRGPSAATLGQTVRALLEPASGPSDSAGPVPAVDFAMLVEPREADRAAIRSLLADTLASAVRRGELKAEVSARVDDLVKAHPDDLAAQVAAVLVAAASGPGAAEDQTLAAAATRLLAVVEKAPLDDLSSGSRANARQRAEAARRLGLWLAARACWTRDVTREAGDRLAAHALEAARRQPDALWALAMLREWGQAALDRGDRAGAERLWTQMLDQALAVSPAASKDTAAPTTLERFELAAALARLYARQGLAELSLRAVRQALETGPPVIPIALDPSARSRMMMGGRRGADAENPAERQVETRLTELDALWKARKAPPALVYQTLRAVVLPDSRPSEVFLYPRSLAGGVGQRQGQDQDPARTGSGAQILVRWAAAGGALDDLRQQIKARQAQPGAELPAQVLTALWALGAGDRSMAPQAIAALEPLLKKDASQHAAELACLAALPALDAPEMVPPALAVLGLAVKNFGAATATATEPLAGLQIALARACFRVGKVEEGRSHVREYHAVLTRTMPNYGGDYGLYVRKQHLQQVGDEYARAGQWSDVLDTLGEFVDAPPYRGGEPSLGNVVTRLAVWLAGLPPRERYDRIKAWTLPTANRSSVRLLATYVPEDAPPAVFGNFKSTTFDGGMASTAAMLIEAARAVDALDDLARQAAEVDRTKVEDAGTLLILTQIAREQSGLAKARIRERTAKVKAMTTGPIPWSDLILVRACLNDPELERDPGEAYARALIGLCQKTQSWQHLSHLRRDLGLSLARRAGSEVVRPGGDVGLALWHPAASFSARQHAGGAVPAWWIEAEGHVQQVTGPMDQQLLFDYPLMGRFAFAADAWVGGWSESSLGYGGLVMERPGANNPISVSTVGHSDPLSVPNRNFRPNSFNRMAVEVEPGKVRYTVNGHLVYEDDDPSPTAPWLSLYGSWQRTTTYRNFTLTGTPEVLRAVPLVQGDRLEGWVSRYFNETQPPRRSLGPDDPRRAALASDSALDEYDWIARDGVLYSQRSTASPGGSNAQSWLYYYRPLRPADAVTYEFYYAPDADAAMTHPTLDRLAFLLQPEGVRVHWITDGPDDCTGLKPENTADEPANRRGPARLPLKPGAWNSARVAVDGNAAVVILNGTEVYRRVLEPENSRQFGFFHFRGQSRAQVRAVSLTGDWPKALTPATLATLVSRRAGGAVPRVDRLAAHAVIGEAILGSAAERVLASARALPPAERYEMLARWVLPGDDHEEFRLQGAFTPLDAAPPVASPGPVPPDSAITRRIHSGGQLESPALELVATAASLGKLADLAERVDSAQAKGEHAQRGQLALRVLIAVAGKRDDDAGTALIALMKLAQPLPMDTPRENRWPEQVAQWSTLGRPALAQPSAQLADMVFNQWHAVRSKNVNIAERDIWGRQVAYARARTRLLASPPAPRGGGNDGLARLPLWSHIEQASAVTRGQGVPVPRWALVQGELQHWEGHSDDYLYLNVPLRGDFTVSGDVSGGNANRIHLVYAGIKVNVSYDFKSLVVVTFGRGSRRVPIEPPLRDLKVAYPCRLEVKDQTLSLFLQGRKVLEEALPPGHDPWLALQQDFYAHTGIKNLKLTGTPTVPESLELSALPDLSGWLAHYYSEPLEGDNPAWAKKGEEIVGINIGSNDRPAPDRFGNQDRTFLQRTARLGSKQESLLQYHRPMLDESVIAYDFFYEPGKSIVHPALDRMAFMLEPDGIKIHWRTDAQDDRTGLAPDNTAIEPENRRGPGPLPLKVGDWNHLELSLEGDMVTLSLNGVLVYERTIEPTNNRQFGLFHYADESEARVRHVVLDGHWPRTVRPNLGFPTPAGAAAKKAAGN